MGALMSARDPTQPFYSGFRQSDAVSISLMRCLSQTGLTLGFGYMYAREMASEDLGSGP